ncbi:hypothetical protein TELCIR_22477, partial [Teladorsagia circumcincta]
IGMIITHKVGRWKVVRNIASGPFSEVFVVVDADNEKAKYAMKCERQEGNQRYCVMQLVGPDLGKLRRSLVAKRLPLSAIDFRQSDNR